MKFPAIMVTKDLNGEVVVSIEVGDKWIEVIRDGQTVISHVVEGGQVSRLARAAALEQENEE